MFNYRFSKIYCQVYWQKKFENRLSFGKVRAKNRVVPFFSGHGVGCVVCIAGVSE